MRIFRSARCRDHSGCPRHDRRHGDKDLGGRSHSPVGHRCLHHQGRAASLSFSLWLAGNFSHFSSPSQHFWFSLSLSLPHRLVILLSSSPSAAPQILSLSLSTGWYGSLLESPQGGARGGQRWRLAGDCHPAGPTASALTHLKSGHTALPG